MIRPRMSRACVPWKSTRPPAGTTSRCYSKDPTTQTHHPARAARPPLSQSPGHNVMVDTVYVYVYACTPDPHPHAPATLPCPIPPHTTQHPFISTPTSYHLSPPLCHSAIVFTNKKYIVIYTCVCIWSTRPRAYPYTKKNIVYFKFYFYYYL